VLLDHGEEVAEQRSFLGGELLGDLGDGCGRPVDLLGANPRVAAAIAAGGVAR
jgi:hypothetical protein